MKNKLLGLAAGIGLIAALPLAANADARVYLGLGYYGPPAVVVQAPPPAYDAYGPTVVYQQRWDDAERWREQQWREYQWRQHEWREHHWRDDDHWDDDD